MSGRIETMSDDELYKELDLVEALLAGQLTWQDEQAVTIRARRIDAELERREYDASDPWSHENHHD